MIFLYIMDLVAEVGMEESSCRRDGDESREFAESRVIHSRIGD
jgi:hypothetical protein